MIAKMNFVKNIVEEDRSKLRNGKSPMRTWRKLRRRRKEVQWEFVCSFGRAAVFGCERLVR